MTLKSITILNFKGIKSLKLDLDGESASIYGANGAGKSTIYDAFLFLLFGKDSRGSATFSIKPILADGEPVHNVETSVEAVLDDTTLRRVYREVWTRRRGDAEDSFSGHETLYFVDGLPQNQSNYKKTVEGIMPETLFRALTNPFYFPEVMKWQDRRSQLFKLFGCLTDEDVAATDERFTELLNLCGRYTVEQFAQGLKVKIKGYNSTLKELPARIDEASRQVIEDDDITAAEAAVDALADEIRSLRSTMTAQDDAELVAQRVAIETEIMQLQHANDVHKEQIRVENAERNRAAMNALAQQIKDLGLNALEADVRVALNESNALEQRLADLRARFTAVASEPYTAQDKCPTCGRPFPAEDLQTAKSAWEAHQKERLDAINAEGRELSSQLKGAKQRASEASDELSRRQKIHDEYQQAMNELTVAELAHDMDGFAEQMTKLTDKRSAILEAIQAATAGAKAKVAEIAMQLASKQAEYAEARKALAAVTASITARARIEELREQQAQTVEALEDAEATVALCEEFVRARVALVTDSINSHFDLVRWQLYRDQINGGLEEICEATVDGIPYHDLNGAMRINAGLDIIHACSQQTGQSAPIFVDNAESVTDLYTPGDAQVIRLVVSADDAQLRLEK